MREQTRNLLVGITVIVALIALGAMILVFQELPAFVQLGYPVRLHFYATGGVTEGSDVLLAGKRIGRITEIAFVDGDARKGVRMTALIDRGQKVPGTVNAYLRSVGFAGGAVVDLKVDGKDPGAGRTDPATGGPLLWLPTDGSIALEGSFLSRGFITAEDREELKKALSGILPEDMRREISETMVSFRRLADRLDGFFAPPEATTRPQATSASGPSSRPAPRLHTTLAKLNAALDAVNKTLGDPENQASLKAGLARFKEAAAAAAQAMEEARATFREVRGATGKVTKRFDELTLRLMADADRLSKVLGAIQRTTEKIEAGDGTAAKLLNDPKLYNTLVDATAQLKTSLEKLELLLAQWKDKGVKLDLK